ncbi:hypothetical protein V8E36_001054 [Tilletia maclaganii]
MPVVAYTDLVPRQFRLGTPHPHAHSPNGTVDHLYGIYDDLDDLNVNRLNISDDDAIIENAMTDINADTIADIASNRHLRGRAATGSNYTRRFSNYELEQVVESRTAHIHARLNTAENDTVVLRRLLSRRLHATRRFDFDTRSLWTRRNFRKGDFDHMAPARVKALAKQLLRAADDHINYPIICRNALHLASSLSSP